jgi:dolichol-phosphate hexosyltransferase
VKLSILMPVYNEAETVEVVVKRVLDVSYPCDVELVIVDDGSSDATPALLARVDDPRVTVHTHPVNRGVDGDRHARGDVRRGPGVLARGPPRTAAPGAGG